ncbi:hypothetical protein [Gorillibacterium sp. CAU 1737]|uniref:hypothetical protein n=1 Tax=Gorillibacterium sp. CAU 1737 TaxID=3140362 RepID=UPI003260138C
MRNKKTSFLFLSTAIIMGTIGFLGYNALGTSPKDAIFIHQSLPKLDTSILSSDSDLIVRGQVKEIMDAEWNTIDKKAPIEPSGFDVVYTDVKVGVKEVIKGSSDNEIVVRVYAGKASEGVEVINDGESSFENGEEIILFLIPDRTPFNKENEHGHYRVMGGYQGKYLIEGQTGLSKQVTNQFENKNLNYLLQEIENSKYKPKQIIENIEGKL